MSLRRVPPLAFAFALMASALVATTWATRSTVNSAFDAAREGEALAMVQAVRADLADLGGPPTEASLAAVLAEHTSEGLRYLATVEAHGAFTAAGTPVGGPPSKLHGHSPEITHVGGRVRLDMRATFHRAWGEGGQLRQIVMEVEPVAADELRTSASWTLAVGALAALTLVGVAIALVRREVRRQSEERTRERERRLASLGEMSAVLAHEIRNPLASLKGNAQLLAAGLDDRSRPKAERVVDEAKRLEQLTTDLLAFVRTGELARAPVSPAQLVREIDPAVELDDANAPATWSLDAGRMREVLVNLIDNARTAGPPVRARIATERERLVIEISDQGPGVPSDDRERIFEPFFTGKTRGTGLGLAIARRVVELHRGTIAVHDGPQGGATFRIEIP